MRHVGSAPGRVNLIGEHTDYSDGLVLPFAIDARTRVSAVERDDGALRISSAQQPDATAQLTLRDLRPGHPPGWAAYVAGVVSVLRAGGVEIPGLDIVVDSDVPMGAGLSSSAALTCACALAVTGAAGVRLTPSQLARVAWQAEHDYVGVPCGVMDQVAVTSARAGHALFLDVRSMAIEHVPLRPADHDLELLVVDTGARHRLADGAYADRRRDVERAAAALGVTALRDVSPDDLPTARRRLPDDTLWRRTRHVVTENQRVLDVVSLLHAGRLADVGPLLDASHRSLREDFEVSSAELDTVVDASKRAGALGARLTGGGFGGSVIVLAPAERSEAIAAAVTAAAHAAGHPTPTVMPVVPSDGATTG